MTVPSTESQTRPGYGEGRDALLTATVRVVARRGLRNLTYRAVAEEAGVTHGLVAHYFGWSQAPAGWRSSPWACPPWLPMTRTTRPFNSS